MSRLIWKWALMVPIISLLFYIVAKHVIQNTDILDQVEITTADYNLPNENDRAVLEKLEYDLVESDGIPQRSDFLNQLKALDNSNAEYSYDFEVDRIMKDIKNTTEYTMNHSLPIILWWTPFTGEVGTVKKCPEGSCYFTQDRKFWNHNLTKTFVFYGTNLEDNDLPLPRRDDHEWAILHEESPKNNLLFHHEDFLLLFNHTCTFRQQSDYPITTQYLSSLAELQRKPIMNFTQKDSLNLSSTIYLQSGCNPPSDRDAYVNELMKYLNVDSYGACLKNKELPSHLKSPLTMHDDSLRDFVGKYKFALTFENAICNDYITEKLWRPLAGGTIPVYKGAPNILEWLPDNQSVILVDDFQSPQQLAEFLNTLAKNETEYHKYLSFKHKGITNNKLIQHMKARPWGVNDIYKMSFITGFECLLCDRIHKNRKLKVKGEKPISYLSNNEHYGCSKPVTYPYESPPRAESWEREIWGDEYYEMKNKARDLHAKIARGMT